MQTVQTAGASQVNPAQPVDDDTLLTSAQVRAQVSGVSPMCIWRWTRDPRVLFPEPDIIINNRKYWKAGTIRQFKARVATKVAA
jgi:hypothetical protein